MHSHTWAGSLQANGAGCECTATVDDKACRYEALVVYVLHKQQCFLSHLPQKLGIQIEHMAWINKAMFTSQQNLKALSQ